MAARIKSTLCATKTASFPNTETTRLTLDSAGLGVPPQSLADDGFFGIDPFARAEDSSTAFLRQQLIGNKAKGRKVPPPTRSAINLPGVEPGFQPSKLKGITAALSSTVQNDQGMSNVGNTALDLDDEDDIGRSGLGERKRGLKGKSTSSPTPASTLSADGAAKGQKPMNDSQPSLARDGNDEEDSQNQAPEFEDIVAKAPITKKSKSSTKPKARSYLDEILAAKEAKKQRRKNKGGRG